MGSSIAPSFESNFIKQPYLVLSSKVGNPPTKAFDIQRHLRLSMISNQSGALNKIQSSQERQRQEMILHAKEEDLKQLIAEDSTPVCIGSRENKYPFSAVGMIVSTRKARTIIGTGSLIGPNLVLTCAHNCYDAVKKQMYDEIRFIPSCIETEVRRDQLENDNLGFKSSYIYIPQQYKTFDLQNDNVYNQSLLYDYALIVLDTDLNLEAYFGTLGYDFNWQESKHYKQTIHNDKNLSNMEIYGYPLHYYGPEYRHFKGSAYNDKNYLLYTMNTKGGVSGAPVLLNYQDCSTIRGIHVRDVSNMLLFSGKGALKLSAQMFVDIKKNAINVRQEHIYKLNNKKIDDKQLVKVLKKIEKYELELNKNNNLKISLAWNSITANGCLTFTKILFQNLHTLNLAKNNIQDQGCLILSQITWKHLHTLNLGSNKITDEGCKHLSKGYWLKLHELYLGWNLISALGCKFLTEGPWKNMGALKLWGNNVDEMTRKDLIMLGWSVQIYEGEQDGYQFN